MKRLTSSLILNTVAVIAAIALIFSAFWYQSTLPPAPPALTFTDVQLQQMVIDPDSSTIEESEYPPYVPTEEEMPPTTGFTSAVARFGTMAAYGEHSGNINTLTLVKGSSSMILATGTNVFGTRNTAFGRPSFSPDGNYLSYHRIGWEWSAQVIYNIAAGETALTVDGGEGTFNSAETLFYTCFINHFGGEREARVYRVPGFIPTVDLYQRYPDLNNFFTLECREDKQNNVLVFDFSGLQKNDGSPIEENVHRVFNVDLNTGALLLL